MNTLPNKPSVLIRVALSDLRKVERDERYKVNMAAWHRPLESACFVCLAGAVMAKTLEVPITKTICNPEPFSSEIFYALYALDNFRRGKVDAGFWMLAIDMPPHIPSFVTIPHYRNGPEVFHAAMNEMTRQLKKAGY